MSTFIGKIEAKLDSKGRVFVPSSFRRLLPQEQRNSVVLRLSPDGRYIVLYPEEVWNDRVNDLKNRLNRWNADDEMLLMQFVADAEWVDLDSQGRMLISKRHIAQLGIGNEVVFVGMVDRIAVWSKEAYEAEMAQRASLNDLLNAKFAE